MYDKKEFTELEALGLNDHLFMDPQVITSMPGFSAVACTISDKDGRRVFRSVEGTHLADVTECAMAIALCAYYNKPVPDVFNTEGKTIPAGEPANTSSVGTGKQAPSTKNTSTHQNNPADTKQIKTPTVGGTAASGTIEDKTPKTAPKDNTTAAASAPISANTTAGPAANSTPPAKNTAAAQDDSDNFRVLVGKYKNRDDNYIKQMLDNEEGRKFLKGVVNIAQPSATIKPYVDQTKDYLNSHGIQL